MTVQTLQPGQQLVQGSAREEQPARHSGSGLRQINELYDLFMIDMAC